MYRNIHAYYKKQPIKNIIVRKKVNSDRQGTATENDSRWFFFFNFNNLC